MKNNIINKLFIIFVLIFFSSLYARECIIKKGDRLYRSSRPDKETYAISPSGHFYIHYDNNGNAAPNPLDINNNGVPDYIDEVGLIADSARYVLVDLMGYTAEPDDGDGVYDIYIMAYSPGTYGYSMKEGNGASYMKIDNDYTGFDSPASPLQLMQITVGHEFFHAIHFGYKHNFTSNEAYFFEMSSMWFEDLLVPNGNDYLLWLDPLFNNPTAAFDDTGPGYELALFGHYLSRITDTSGINDEKESSIIRSIWEHYSTSGANPFASVQNTIENYGGTFIGNWCDFITLNLFNGIDPSQYYYEDQDLIEPIQTNTENLSTITFDLQLDEKSAAIRSFEMGENSAITLTTMSSQFELTTLYLSTDNTIIISENNSQNFSISDEVFSNPPNIGDNIHFIAGITGDPFNLSISIETSELSGIWYVSDSEGVDSGSGNAESPFATIQHAIDLAADGQTILVSPGIYRGEGNIDLNFKGKAISVISESGPPSTIIDCENKERGFTFDSGEDSTSVLDGFTITDGNRFNGGGISVSSSPIIRNCIITNCSADYGGGIYLYNSNPSLENVDIMGNSATYGGGIYCNSSSPTLIDVTVGNNTANKDGGGVYCYFNSNPSLQGITITHNSAVETGGGIYLRSQSNAVMKNVLISNNTADGSGGGMRLLSSNPLLFNLTISKNSAQNGGGMIIAGSNPQISNSNIWDNVSGGIYFSSATGYASSVAITYSDIQGGEEGIITNDNGEVQWLNGNIDSDPLFVDPANGDFRLQADSPCIDGGTNDTDGDGIADITDYIGTDPDIGAFEIGYGCMDASACNYDTMATDDDLSCIYSDANYNCDGECTGDDFDGDNICDLEDMDDDNDGSPDYDDSDDNNEFECSDDDGDSCDDCSNGSYDTDSECNYDINVALHEGANLISFFALPDDNSVENIFDGADGVIGEGVGAVYLEGSGWIGSLTLVRQDDGYWVKVSEDTTLELINCEPVNYDYDGIVIYNMHMGNNLISYPFITGQYIADALGDAASNVYALAGEGVAALNTGISWVGSLSVLEGGHGYWLITADDFSFSFSSGAADGLTRPPEQPALRVIPEVYSFSQSDQQAFFFVQDATNNDEALESDDIIIAYNGDVIVGARYWFGEFTDVPAMGSEAGDKISFKVWDASAGTLLDMVAGGDVEWNSMGISVINLCSSSPCALSNNSFFPVEYSLSRPYPNPFNPVTSIRYSTPVYADVELIIYDITGRQIQTLVNDFQTAGYHSINWNASSYSSGVYLIRMVSGQYIKTRTVMLVK